MRHSSSIGFQSICTAALMAVILHSTWTGGSLAASSPAVLLARAGEPKAAFRAEAAAPRISLSPATLDFGIVLVGQRPELRVTITNTGSANLSVTSVSLPPPFYLLTGSPGSPLPPGGSANMDVRFIPSTNGTVTSELAFTSNDPVNPTAKVTVTGTGTTVTLGVRSVEPSRGLPGTSITISGTNFHANISSNRVEIGGRVASISAIRGPHIIALVPPELQPGTVPLRVITGGKTSAPVNFTVLAANSIPLGVKRVGTNAVLSWSASPSDFLLESAPSLAPPVQWQPVTNAVNPSGNELTATVAGSEASRFYRLKTATVTVITGQATIPAAQGGTVASADGTVKLTVPPGALAADTEIRFTHFNRPPEGGRLVWGETLLSPAGLKFSQPATLSIKTPISTTRPDDLTVYTLSAQNPGYLFGGEIHHIQFVTNFNFNVASQTLDVPVSHFSWVGYSHEEDIYVVLEIDGKYLKKSDLIFALTGPQVNGALQPLFPGHYWFSGHVGLYLGTENPGSGMNDGETIIESTPKDDRLGQPLDGVQYGRLTHFKVLAGEHIYMGARRPRNFSLTDDDRSNIAQWAVDKLRTPYATAGGPFVSADPILFYGLSCVGLTEGAYDAAGKSLVPGLLEAILWPLRQFRYTVPVNEITLKVGEKFQIYVNGVVKPVGVRGDYYDDKKYYTMQLDVDLDSAADRAIKGERAKFVNLPYPETTRRLDFTPSNDDADQTHVFRFTVDAAAAGLGKVTERLFVKVEPATATRYIRKDPPRVFVRNSTGNLDSKLLTVPPSGTEASINSGTNKIRLFWEAPPASISAGASFDMTIVPDNGTAPASVRQTLGWAPFLQGQINDYVAGDSSNNAFAGYEGSLTCSDCYTLAKKPLTKSASITEPGRGVRVEIRYSHGYGPSIRGSVEATIIWDYEPAP